MSRSRRHKEWRVYWPIPQSKLIGATQRRHRRGAGASHDRWAWSPNSKVWLLRRGRMFELYYYPQLDGAVGRHHLTTRKWSKVVAAVTKWKLQYG